MHAVPHAPQFFGSLPTSVHAPLHDCAPNGHWQVPARHAWPLAQALPHAPQFASSFDVSRHLPPQSASPTAHVDWQLPLAQTSPASQTWAHEPQFFPSDDRSRHVVPHADCPPGQVVGGGGTQSPATPHVCPDGQSELVEHWYDLPPQLEASTTTSANARTNATERRIEAIDTRGSSRGLE